MIEPKKDKPKSALEIFNEIKRLTNSATSLKQEISEKTVTPDILSEELTLGSGKYPENPEEVIVSGRAIRMKSATELKIIERADFAAIVRTAEDKVIAENSSWRTAPVINFFTQGRKKLLAQQRATRQYNETTFPERPYRVNKKYLTAQYGVLAEGHKMRLCPLGKLESTKRLIELNGKIRELVAYQFYTALENYTRPRKDSVKTIQIESDYIAVEALGVSDPILLFTGRRILHDQL